MWRKRNDNLTSVLIVVFLFSLALLIRLVGVDWQGGHPDENIGDPARVLTGQLSSEMAFYPPFLNYLVSGGYIVLLALGWAFGWWESLSEFRNAYFNHPELFYITLRVVVATCAATFAPIAFLLARQLNLSFRAAFLVGLVAITVPGAVFWAHIGKSDSALAPCFLLVALTGLRLLERSDSKSRPILTGLAIALAVSFKQSAVFFVVPLVAAFFLSALVRGEPKKQVIGGWSLVAATTVLFWIPFNIGIVLDPSSFLDAQLMQSQMSYRSATPDVMLSIWFRVVTGLSTGVPIVSLAIVPIVIAFASMTGKDERKPRFFFVAFGVSWLIASLTLVSIAGSRQPDHLWLPYVSVALIAGGIAAGALTDCHRFLERIFGYTVFVILLVGSLVRIVPILTQAIAIPVGARVATVIRAHVPMGARIATDIPLNGLPISPESARIDRARHERLARRYNVTLRQPARPITGQPDGYIVTRYRFVIGGMERYRSSDVKVVLPYAWPMQPEEWKIENWLNEGYRYFVVGNSAFMEDPVPEYRTFFRAIDRRCTRLFTIAPRRPIFSEAEARVYRCDRNDQRKYVS